MNNTLSKDELSSKLAAKCEIANAQANDCIGKLMDIIQEALVERRKVEFRGFGCFTVRTRAARAGRNPATAEKIQIPAKTVVKFSIGSHLEDALNKEAVPAPAA